VISDQSRLTEIHHPVPVAAARRHTAVVNSCRSAIGSAGRTPEQRQVVACGPATHFTRTRQSLCRRRASGADRARQKHDSIGAVGSVSKAIHGLILGLDHGWTTISVMTQKVSLSNIIQDTFESCKRTIYTFASARRRLQNPWNPAFPALRASPGSRAIGTSGGIIGGRLQYPPCRYPQSGRWRL